MEQIIQKMVELAARHEPFTLATVIVRNGSAPRSAGAKMLVAQDGEIAGTVGGGILEAQVRDLAARIFKERYATIQSFQFNGKDAASMDAICGGQVEVLIEWVDPGNPDTAAVIQGLATRCRHTPKGMAGHDISRVEFLLPHMPWFKAMAQSLEIYLAGLSIETVLDVTDAGPD